MRKLVFLLAIVAVAAAPSLASAKMKHKGMANHAKMHGKMHGAKQAKTDTWAGPNGNTVHLLHDMVMGKY